MLTNLPKWLIFAILLAKTLDLYILKKSDLLGIPNYSGGAGS
jgi:hypothetical protein